MNQLPHVEGARPLSDAQRFLDIERIPSRDDKLRTSLGLGLQKAWWRVRNSVQDAHARAASGFDIIKRNPGKTAAATAGAALLAISGYQGIDDSARERHDGIVDAITDTTGHIIGHVGTNIQTTANGGARVAGTVSRGLYEASGLEGLVTSFDKGWGMPDETPPAPNTVLVSTDPVKSVTSDGLPPSQPVALKGKARGRSHTRTRTPSAPDKASKAVGADSFARAAVTPAPSVGPLLVEPSQPGSSQVVVIEDENITYSRRSVRVETPAPAKSTTPEPVPEGP